jgi:hypothetical protein
LIIEFEFPRSPLLAESNYSYIMVWGEIDCRIFAGIGYA